MSRILTVAREDLRHASRERLVWGAVVLLGAMFLPSAAAVADPEHRPFAEFLLLVPLDLLTFALVVVAAVGYNAVVGERASGTARLVFGLGATRRDIVLGKALSRAGITALALGVVFVVANAVVFQGYGRAYLVPFWVMAGWMLLYAMVWTAVTVGYSAAFTSQYRTLGALAATYAVFSLDVGVWNVVFRPLFAFLLTGSTATPAYETLATAPTWFRVVERLNPLVNVWEAMRWSVEAVGPGTPVGGPLPHLLGTALFLGFGAVPLVVGLRRLERADLDAEGGGLGLGARLWRVVHRTGGTSPVAGVATGVPTRTAASRVWTLAGEDVRHALQNWVVVGGLGLTLLLVGPELWSGLDPGGVSTVSEDLADVGWTFALPVLVLGIAVGYSAVVGEREAGTARLVLGLPATRRDLVLAKVVSRVGLTVVTLVPLVLAAEVLVVVRYGGVYAAAFAAWAGWVLLYGAVWTSVVVGISAAVSTRYRSLAAVFGTFLVFDPGVGLWRPVVRPLFAFALTGRFSAREFAQSADSPLWFRYTDHLNPFVALESVQEGLYSVAGIGPRAAPDAPLVGFSVVITVLFAAGPLYLGYRRFDRTTLG